MAFGHPSKPRPLPGDVQAPDEGAAEAGAVSEFKLSDEQRKRLLVQERN
jgi:hypothetical protein